MNIPTKNLNIMTQMNEGAADVRLPYQNRNRVAHIRIGRRPYLSAIIPHKGAPSIIPKCNYKRNGHDNIVRVLFY